MSLREVDSRVGAPWSRPPAGTLERLVIESRALAGNPLGDPCVRPLYVYRAPGAGAGSPVIFMLQAWGLQLDMWEAREAFDPTRIERIDALWSNSAPALAGAGASPQPAVIVFVDAWTSLGGSQFLNSPAIGNYLDYVCDELVPFIDERYGIDRSRRALLGHSSGGYGALMLPMLRPGLFAAAGAHAPDSLFEYSVLPQLPGAFKVLRDRYDGSLKAFWEDFRTRERFDYDTHGELLGIYAMAAAYAAADDGTVSLPFDLETGALDPVIWDLFLRHDPVRAARRHGEQLRRLRYVYLEAGRRDMFNLDLGAAAFAAELALLGVAHEFELHDGGHGGVSVRHPLAIRALLNAL